MKRNLYSLSKTILTIAYLAFVSIFTITAQEGIPYSINELLPPLVFENHWEVMLTNMKFIKQLNRQENIDNASMKDFEKTVKYSLFLKLDLNNEIEMNIDHYINVSEPNINVIAGTFDKNKVIGWYKDAGGEVADDNPGLVYYRRERKEIDAELPGEFFQYLYITENCLIYAFEKKDFMDYLVALLADDDDKRPNSFSVLVREPDPNWIFINFTYIQDMDSYMNGVFSRSNDSFRLMVTTLVNDETKFDAAAEDAKTRVEEWNAYVPEYAADTMLEINPSEKQIITGVSGIVDLQGFFRISRESSGK